MGNAVTQLARTLDARHAVSTTTSLAKAAEALRYFVEFHDCSRPPEPDHERRGARITRAKDDREDARQDAREPARRACDMT
jgi:hypothetical protein